MRLDGEMRTLLININREVTSFVMATDLWAGEEMSQPRNVAFTVVLSLHYIATESVKK